MLITLPSHLTSITAPPNSLPLTGLRYPLTLSPHYPLTAPSPPSHYPSLSPHSPLTPLTLSPHYPLTAPSPPSHYPLTIPSQPPHPPHTTPHYPLSPLTPSHYPSLSLHSPLTPSHYPSSHFFPYLAHAGRNAGL